MVENYGKSIETKKQQLTAPESSVDTATKVNLAGQGEYLDVLLAQRDLMEAGMVIIETKQQQLTAVINAYQALGGGMYAGNFNTEVGVEVNDPADAGDKPEKNNDAVPPAMEFGKP